MASISNIKTQASYYQLLTWFLSPKSVYVEREEPWNIPLIAQNLCHLYNLLPSDYDDLRESKLKIDGFSIENYPDEDSSYLEPLVSLSVYAKFDLSNYLSHFLIHGSLATLDYSIGWSDLDTFVVVNDQTLGNSAALVSFRQKIIDAHKYLVKIDPHQHHGFIFGSESGLGQYFSHFIPRQVLQESKSLMGATDIELKYSRNVETAIMSFSAKNELLYSAYKHKTLRHHKYENEYLDENYKNINTMYQLKYFLSVVMTLPTYYLDAKGDPCYKKHSFTKVKDEFSDVWEIIEKASYIRMEWPKRETHPYQTNIIPEWVIEYLGEDYFSRAYKLSSKMMKSLNALG